MKTVTSSAEPARAGLEMCAAWEFIDEEYGRPKDVCWEELNRKFQPTGENDLQKFMGVH